MSDDDGELEGISRWFTDRGFIDFANAVSGGAACNIENNGFFAFGNIWGDAAIFALGGEPRALAKGAGVLSNSASVASAAESYASTTQTVRFGENANQISHAFRHISEVGLTASSVSAAVEADLANLPLHCRSIYRATVVVKGIPPEHSAYGLDNGIINV